MHISARGIALIKQFEGLSLNRYYDSVDVATIGFGTTEGDLGHPVPESCTLAQAEQWLREGMARTYEPPINALGVPLNQNQFDALCSLVYNCGPGAMSWQIGTDLRHRDYAAAANDFLRYVYAGGQRLQGLVNRREAERALFLKPWHNPDPHHYLWFDDVKRDLGKRRHGCERNIVEEYDRKRRRPRAFRFRIRRLRDDMSILAGRLENVMRDDPKHNDANHREWRHAQLVGRARDRRYV